MLTLLMVTPLHPQELTDASFEKWRDLIHPRPDELLWRKIPWRPTLWEAVCEAQREDKPLLFWLMNGHPLACT
jgi:hypothetical protein